MKFFEKHKSPFLLSAILLTLLSSPFITLIEFEWGPLLLAFALSVLIGIGGFLISGSKQWLSLYSIAIALVFVAIVTEFATEPHISLTFCRNLGIILIQGCALYVALRYALSHKGNALDRTIAGICGYFLLAMIWSNFFVIIQSVDPMSFKGRGMDTIFNDAELLYFSLVNLTTLGYGDIVPINSFARIVATLESAFGTLYLAVMVATLVSELRVSKRSL